MPGKFPFAHLNGSWVPLKFGSKGQDHTPIRTLWQGPVIMPGLDVLISLLVTPSEIPHKELQVPIKHPRTNRMVGFPSCFFFLLCCFFPQNLLDSIFVSSKIFYFFHPLEIKILQATSLGLDLPSFALKAKGASGSHFSTGSPVCLEQLGLTKVLT